MHHCFLISWLYSKKNMIRLLKDKSWRLKHDYKNIKDFDYQSDQPQHCHQPQQSDPLMLYT